MRLYKRWLVAVIVLLFAFNSCAIPLTANATDDGTATATSVTDVVSSSSEDTEEQSELLPSDGQEAPTASVESVEDTQEEPVVESAGGSTSDNESQSEAQLRTQPCISGKYLGSSDFIPGYTAVKHPDPTAKSDPVEIEVNENFGVVVDSRATANTGNSDAAGTKATNVVGGASQATAIDGSGEPIDPDDPNFGGTYAGNEVLKNIGNTGTASAVAGVSEANNTMNDNEAIIAPETCFSSKGSGKIIDSDIKVNAKLNYWALISGLSEATSGDSSATGTSATNLLKSNDNSIAKGDSSPSSDGDVLGGDVVSVNESENSILNNADALAATGASKADNIMEQNDVTIAPSVEAVLNICGDVINSNVTVNLVYNILAVISGLARASTGDSEAAGAIVDNKIDNQTSSTAVGDSSSNPVGDGSQELSGGAVAMNDTSNGIENEGSALGLSGDADALNSMIENAITIAPVVCGQIDLLESIVNANVVINICYNFWATISGQANAESGSADANGLIADNSINNKSKSLAIGDSGGSGIQGGDSGNSTALNDTNNNISNKGDAGSVSGDSIASNSMLGNIIDLSPVLASAVALITPLTDGTYVIDVVYNIWTSLDGSADSKTGDTDSFGAICSSSIDSRSDAVAIAKIGSVDENGSALATNSSDNDIGSVGSAAALSGQADAMSDLSNSFIGMTGYLIDDIVFDNSYAPADRYTSFKAGINEGSEALSGDAAAVGVAAVSHMRSGAISKDIFGNEGVSVNDSDDDILNEGRATADSGDVLAQSGVPHGPKDPNNNSGDVVFVGFDRPGPSDAGNEIGSVKVASVQDGNPNNNDSGGNSDNGENKNNSSDRDNNNDNDQGIVGNGDGNTGNGDDEGGNMSALGSGDSSVAGPDAQVGDGGFSVASIFRPDRVLGYFESVIGADYYNGLPIPPLTPLWPRGIAGLFTTVMVLALTRKPWRIIARGQQR